MTQQCTVYTQTQLLSVPQSWSSAVSVLIHIFTDAHSAWMAQDNDPRQMVIIHHENGKVDGVGHGKEMRSVFFWASQVPEIRKATSSWHNHAESRIRSCRVREHTKLRTLKSTSIAAYHGNHAITVALTTQTVIALSSGRVRILRDCPRHSHSVGHEEHGQGPRTWRQGCIGNWFGIWTWHVATTTGSKEGATRGYPAVVGAGSFPHAGGNDSENFRVQQWSRRRDEILRRKRRFKKPCNTCLPTTRWADRSELSKQR